MTEAVTHTVGTLMGGWHVRLVLQQKKVLAYLNNYIQKKGDLPNLVKESFPEAVGSHCWPSYEILECAVGS